MKSVRKLNGNESNYDVLVKYIIIDNLIELHNFIPNIENYNEDLEFTTKTDFNRNRVLCKNFLKSFIFSGLSAEVISNYFVMDFDGDFKLNTVLIASVVGTVLFQSIYNKEINKKSEKWTEEYIDKFESDIDNLETDFNIIVDNFIEYVKIAGLSDFDIECEVHKIFTEGSAYLKHKKDNNLVDDDFNSSIACDDIDYICEIEVFNNFINSNTDVSKVRIR